MSPICDSGAEYLLCPAEEFLILSEGRWGKQREGMEQSFICVLPR